MKATNKLQRVRPTQLSSSEHGKLPPQDIELEQIVLGAIMLEKSALIQVKEILKAEVFYNQIHQTMYNAIIQLDVENKPIDIMTVKDKLKKNGELESVGGSYYITQLTSRLASSANIESYAHILLQKYLQRELIKFSSQILNEAYDETIDVLELIERCSSDFNIIAEIPNGKSNKMVFVEILTLAISELEKREIMAKQNKLNGIPTGIVKLNHLLNGFQNGDLIIIASRPGMGKTAFSLFFSRVAVKATKKVLYFSLEMDKRHLCDRILIAESGVPADRYRSGYISKSERRLIEDTAAEIFDFKIFIDDKSGVKINYIRTQAQIAKRKNECDMIVIDYLQLIDATAENKSYNREAEIAVISRKCKQIAKELQVPALLLCQLSRNCENRGGDKKPMLSDLRESGAIEQDADIVIFPFRPDYYNLKDSNGDDLTGVGELIIAKHRNGLTGSIPFRHNDSITDFYDYE